MAKKILAVDDSSSVRMLVSNALKNAGYDVLEAANGEDALKVLRSQSVSLIITDINMPRMDGISMIQEARRLPECQFTPIVVLTTEDDGTMKRRAKEAKASGWIIKPFDEDKLLAVVKKFLG